LTLGYYTTRITTRSMIKQINFPDIPTLQEEPIDIPASLEAGDDPIQNINAAKDLVEDNLNELSFEWKDKKNLKKWEDPLVTLTKHQMIVKIQRIQKHNDKLRQFVVEYEVLDLHINKENELLKSQNQKLRDK